MKNKPNLDPRIRRTRRYLREALMELVLEKSYNRISVTDLADQAMINRSTFYHHYREKDALVTSGFEEYWKLEIPGRSVLFGEDGNLIKERLKSELEADLAHFDKHRDFYRTMLCEQEICLFRDCLSSHLRDIIRQRFSLLISRTSPAAAPQGLTVAYLTSAYLGALEWWLEQEEPSSPSSLAQQLSELFLQPLDSLETQDEVFTEEWARAEQVI